MENTKLSENKSNKESSVLKLIGKYMLTFIAAIASYKLMEWIVYVLLF